MRFLYRFSVRHPIPALLAGIAVVAALAPGMARLELRTDGLALVPPDAPAVHEDQRIRDHFGIDAEPVSRMDEIGRLEESYRALAEVLAAAMRRFSRGG